MWNLKHTVQMNSFLKQKSTHSVKTNVRLQRGRGNDR